MSLVLAEPSTAQRVEIPREDNVRVAVFCLDYPLTFTLTAKVLVEPQIELEVGTIDRLDEIGYALLQPIPYRIQREREGDFLATFDEGNIGIGGADAQEAYQNLIAEILDSFDTLSDEQNLTEAAVRQLHVLQTYLVRT